jgi:hypothetical protein
MDALGGFLITFLVLVLLGSAWTIYMATCRTEDYIKLMNADREYQRHANEMEKARFTAKQSAREKRSNAGTGAVKIGLGLARRLMK